MCPRFANGTFPPCPPLDLPPILLNKWYTEGDGLQWTFSVPHNVSALIGLFPSPQAYVDLLQGMMVNTSLWAGPTLAALPNPWRVKRAEVAACQRCPRALLPRSPPPPLPARNGPL